MMRRYLKIIGVCCFLAVLLTAGGLLLQNQEEGRGELEMNRGRRDESRGARQYQVKSETKEQYLPGSSIRIPTVEEVSENQYIYRYNHKLAREKGLLEEDCLNYRYLCLQAVYRANLDAYLLDVLDIRALDEELNSSSLGFVSHKPQNQSLYEEESSMGLRFVCLRNNLYIEYLSEDQLGILAHRLETGKSPVTEEIKDMVKATYQEVIRVREPGEWEAESRFMYPEALGCKPVIPNHALVLGIANAMEYDEAGKLKPDALRREKYEYLEKLKEEKEREYSGILGAEVYILVE